MTHTSASTQLPDSFSWQRIAMLARFHGPAIRLILIIYPAVSLAIGAACYFLNYSLVGMVFSGLLSMLTPLMFYFMPLCFVKGSSPVIDTMLPVTPAERMTFFLLAAYPCNYVLSYGLYFAIQWALGLVVPMGDFGQFICDVTDSITLEAKALGVCQALPPLATCLYVVMTTTRGTIGKAIGWTIATMVALALIGGAIGFYAAFTNIDFKTAVSHPTGSNDFAGGLATGAAIAEAMRPITYSISVICMIYTLFMTWLTYRNLKSRQI